MEGLGRSLHHGIASRNLKGLNLHSDIDPLSHLQFVDDMMLMGHPSTKEETYFKEILDTFLLAYGTLINQDKSLIFFFNTY
jgi:hypothetical protein